MVKRVLAVIIVTVLTVLTAPFTASCLNIYAPDDIKAVVEGVISYKSDTLDAKNTSELLIKLSEHAGDFSSDWYYIAMSQFGIDCKDESSVTALKNTVDGFYSDGLGKVKVTDLQRVAFALSACGEDITDINGHNLLADATYNRGEVRPLDSQGANSASYALLLLDSKNYSIPEDAYNTRKDIIEMIISKELEDGGFSLFGTAADIDLTTIALQALAPYTDREDVRSVVDRGVGILSLRQNKTGAYKSFSNEISCETTAQVILALTALSIDPMTDSRFIKEDNSVADGLMLFRLDNGAFCHFLNGKADNMASYQSLCALVALYRFLNGEKSFYDFTEKPQPEEVNIVPVTEEATEASTKHETESYNSKSENKSTSVTSQPTAETVKDTVEFIMPPTKPSETQSKKNVRKFSSVSESTTESTASGQSLSVKNNSDSENKHEILYIDCVVLLILYIIIFELKRR